MIVVLLPLWFRYCMTYMKQAISVKRICIFLYILTKFTSKYFFSFIVRYSPVKNRAPTMEKTSNHVVKEIFRNPNIYTRKNFKNTVLEPREKARILVSAYLFVIVTF